MLRNPLELHSDDSGTAVMEAVFVMLPMCFFLFLTPALWKIAVSENHCKMRAHRDMFMKSIAMTTAGININVPVFMGGLGTSGPKKPKMPKLDPKPDNSLNGYKKFPNDTIEGRRKEDVIYGNGWSFAGDIDLARQAYTLRAPWTYSEWPMTPKTAQGEASKVKKWFKDAYKETINSNRYNYTNVKKDPAD